MSGWLVKVDDEMLYFNAPHLAPPAACTDLLFRFSDMLTDNLRSIDNIEGCKTLLRDGTSQHRLACEERKGKSHRANHKSTRESSQPASYIRHRRQVSADPTRYSLIYSNIPVPGGPVRKDNMQRITK